MVNIQIVSDLVSSAKDFAVDLPLDELCNKLYTLTGVEPVNMKLQIRYLNGETNFVIPSRMPKDALVLSTEGSNKIESISVQDTNASSMTNQLKNDMNNGSDVSFKLSDEDYAARSSSVLQWKKDNNLGRFDPKYQAKREEELKMQGDIVSQLTLDERCSVNTADQPERRGWLRFIGKVPGISADEIWCGVEFDEPVGKNDGTYKGVTYFGPVSQKYGAFVKPMYVKTGKEYTPEELDFSDSDDDEI